MKEKLQKAKQIHQLVSFVIEEEEYGVNILNVQEIIRMLEISRVPNAPEFIEGVINLRGKIVPVVDLRDRFNLPEIEVTTNSRIIVVELSKRVVGFLVDRVKEVLSVDATIIEPPPDLAMEIDAKYITGVAKLKDRLLTMLDLEKILNFGEQDGLNSLESSAA